MLRSRSMSFTRPLPTVLVCVSIEETAASPFERVRAVMITCGLLAEGLERECGA